MQANLHHIHLFASDLDASIAWWRDMLGGEVAFDGDFGGARNVFMRVGSGRLHLYEQQPRGSTGGAVHHVGIKCHGLPALVEQMKARGVAFRSEIREFGSWRYIMCAAPDNVLLELFEIDAGKMPPALAAYFGGS
jgi:catechol 2,3-dioxygenase-like lactoylglutathione lyase family enzyme